MSAQSPWLAAAGTYVKGWMAHRLRSADLPGCAVAIFEHGRPVLEAAMGVADLRTGEPLTPRHAFRAASHSKSFAAVALLILHERGLLGLDEQVGRYATGLHPEIERRTIRQLLSNTSGIWRDGPDCSFWTGHRPFPNAAQLRRFLEDPPIIQDDSRLKYSNLGFGLAGLVLEKVTGKSYRDWLAREVIAPAGLRETFPDAPAPGPIAAGHSGALPIGRRVVNDGLQPTRALAPAAGLVSTVSDLCRFYGQLDPKASQLLSEEGIAALTARLWDDPCSPSPQAYGLGLIVGRHQDWQWIGHRGVFQGYISRTAAVPEAGFTVSVAINATDGQAAEWVDGVLNICRHFQAAFVDSEPSPWTGRWWSEWGTIDAVAFGDEVHFAAVDRLDPFDSVPIVKLTGSTEGVVARASGFARFGEPANLILDAQGTPCAIRVGGDTYLPEDAFAADMETRSLGPGGCG